MILISFIGDLGVVLSMCSFICILHNIPSCEILFVLEKQKNVMENKFFCSLWFWWMIIGWLFNNSFFLYQVSWCISCELSQYFTEFEGFKPILFSIISAAMNFIIMLFVFFSFLSASGNKNVLKYCWCKNSKLFRFNFWCNLFLKFNYAVAQQSFWILLLRGGHNRI